MKPIEGSEAESSRTDWDHVRQADESEIPIPYEPDDGPYDPNDDEATEAFLTKAEVWAGWPNPVLIKPACKPLPILDEAPERKAS